jgi:hypothetical protein
LPRALRCLSILHVTNLRLLTLKPLPREYVVRAAGTSHRIDQGVQRLHQGPVLFFAPLSPCSGTADPLNVRRLRRRLPLKLLQISDPGGDALGPDAGRFKDGGVATTAQDHGLRRRPQAQHALVHHGCEHLELGAGWSTSSMTAQKRSTRTDIPNQNHLFTREA